MSPEHKVVVNKREGKNFRQLYIDKGTPLASRVKITASHFEVETGEIVDILEKVRGVMLEGQEEVFSEEEREKHLGREPGNYFEGELRDLGISFAHSRNLVLGVAEHLALEKGPYDSSEWWLARLELVRSLREKIG